MVPSGAGSAGGGESAAAGGPVGLAHAPGLWVAGTSRLQSTSCSAGSLRILRLLVWCAVVCVRHCSAVHAGRRAASSTGTAEANAWIWAMSPWACSRDPRSPSAPSSSACPSVPHFPSLRSLRSATNRTRTTTHGTRTTAHALKMTKRLDGGPMAPNVDSFCWARRVERGHVPGELQRHLLAPGPLAHRPGHWRGTPSVVSLVVSHFVSCRVVPG